MVIKEITTGIYAECNASMALHGSVFDSPQWAGMFGDDISHYGLYEGDNMAGGFYIYKKKKYGFSVCCNPPFTPFTGLFFRKDAKSPAKAMDKCKKIMSLVAEFIDKMDCSVVSLSFDKNTIDMQPFIWRDFKVIPHYTYIVELSPSIDDIWMRMSNEKRTTITKGTKDGLVVRRVNDYAIVKSLVLKTFSRQNKTTNVSGVNKILFDFANDRNSFAFAAFNNGNPIACTFCIHDDKAVYYLLGGYDSENKHNCAGTLCVWESIQYAKSLGMPYFDFEGSMVPAIERYFRGFGGQLTPYYRINKAKLPIEMALKFFMRSLF